MYIMYCACVYLWSHVNMAAREGTNATIKELSSVSTVCQTETVEVWRPVQVTSK